MKRIFLRILKFSGITIVILIALFFLGVVWPLGVPQPNKKPDSLLITNVSVVDVETGLLRPDTNILIRDGLIVEIGNIEAENEHTILDARGKFAIPGLFDMHVHSLKMSPSLTHPLFIAAGVTTVRDMGGCIGIEDAWVACVEDKRAWNEAAEAGDIVGPRYDTFASLPINGGKEIPSALDPALGVPNAEGAKLRVEYDKVRGVTFLKTYTNLSREGYFALADEAKKRGLEIAGHLPFLVSGFEAVDAGQRSFEHAFLFLGECFSDIEALRETGDVTQFFSEETRKKMIEKHDPEKCATLQTLMAERNVSFVPTHTTRKLDAYANDEDFRTDPRLKYIPGPLKTLWLGDADGMASRSSDPNLQDFKNVFQFGIKQTGVAHKRGVRVMVGTDAPDSFAFPGFGVYDEMEHFHQAGLSPLEVLKAATLEPAKFLGLENRAGILKPGARADIVLLNENPLLDIRAITSVDSVVLAGVPYSREDLDKMLATVEDNAGSWVMWPKFVWQILMSPIMRKQFGD